MAQVGTGRVERHGVVPLALEAMYQFSCRGCGVLCCTDERLFLSPLEVRWMTRALGADVQELSERGWLVAVADAEYGLPAVMIQSQGVGGVGVCPFLGMTADGENDWGNRRIDRVAAAGERGRAVVGEVGIDRAKAELLRCQIYEARPIMCRTFPLQFRVRVSGDGTPLGWEVCQHVRCPGHGADALQQTVQKYLMSQEGVATLALARIAWRKLQLRMVEVGIGIYNEESCSGSRRALWNAVLNLIFASGGRRYLNIADDCYVAALESLFEEFLVPVAPYVDAELRYAMGELTRGVAIQHVRRLVEACLALERALDDPP